MKLKFLILFVLVSVTTLKAQDKPHKFVDALNVICQSANVAAQIADYETTKQALNRAPGSYEVNPIAQSNGSRIALKVVAVGAGLGLAYAMHKTGHHKLERLVPLFIAAPTVVAAIHNTTVR